MELETGEETKRASEKIMWYYQGFPFDPKIIDQEGYIGFVYLITNLGNGKKYIGKKLFTKSKINRVKGKKKRSRVSSDWENYFGSSKELLRDVEIYHHSNFTREILYLCKRKGECNYYEAYEQMTRHAILSDEYYNDAIRVTVHRVHLGIGKLRPRQSKENKTSLYSIEWKSKISNSLKGRKHSPERIAAIMAGKKNIHHKHSHETKLKMSQTRKKQKWYTNGSINVRKSDSPGDGWKQGRVFEYKWFTDGISNVRKKECPIGWRPGKTSKK